MQGIEVPVSNNATLAVGASEGNVSQGALAVTTYRAFGARLAQEALGGQPPVGGDEVELVVTYASSPVALTCQQ